MNLPGYVTAPPTYSEIENRPSDIIQSVNILRSNVTTVVVPVTERNTNIVMEGLAHTSTVFCELNDYYDISRDGRTRYSIKNADGTQIYYTFEPYRRFNLLRCLCCYNNNWKCFIRDNYHRKICSIDYEEGEDSFIIKSLADVHIMTIVREFSDKCECGLVGVDATGQRIFRIDITPTIGKAIMHVVKTTTGEVLAKIDKTLGCLFLELVSEGDAYKIDYQQNLDTEMKAVILVTVLIIDKLYYAKYRA